MQIQISDNGGAALAMMLGSYGKYVTVQDMRQVCISTRNGSSPEQIIKAAAYYGLDAQLKKVPAEELRSMKLPLIACWKRKYYTIIKKISGDKVVVIDPAKGEYTLKWEKFQTQYNGDVILTSPGEHFEKGGKPEKSYIVVAKRLSPYKKSLAFLFALSALATVANMAYIDAKKSMLDDVMKGGRSDLYMTLLITMALLWFAANLIKAIDELMTYKTSREMAAVSGAVLYKRLLKLPLTFFEKSSRGEIMERLEENRKLDNTLITTFVPKLFNSVALIFYLYIIYRYNAVMSSVVLAVFLLLAILILVIQARISMYNRSVLSAGEQNRAVLLNGLNNIDTIKLSGAETGFFHLWHQKEQDFIGASKTIIIYEALHDILQNAQLVLTSAVMIFFGAYLIINGHITLGILSAFQSVFSTISSSLTSMVSTSKQFHMKKTNIERINDMYTYDCEPDRPLDVEDPNKLSGNLRVDHLTYRYNAGDEPAISDISFEVRNGEMVALVGRSGCGKSTLLKLVTGLYTVQEGSITYDGKSRNEIPDVIFSSSIASVDQDFVMFDDTVRNNLKLWDETIEDYEMVIAARDAQIYDRIAQNPNGYDSCITGGGKNYSGGELQRFELARALAMEPTLLILDEFTSALDSLTEEKMFRAIKDKGTSCLIAAHRLSTIVECDKIIVMEGGHIVETGTHKELYDKHGLYYELVSMQ